MIITEIHLENFTTFYDKKSFNIGPRLNIILGENNHGKTQLYKALHWLITGDEKDLIQRVSDKKLNETAKHGTFLVSVKIVGQQLDEKRTLIRSFTAEKRENGAYHLGKCILEATIEKSNGERIKANAEAILKQMFDPKMTKYLFFEGEGTIHETFNDDEALSNLTRHFSGADQYDTFSNRGRELSKQFDSVIEKETKKNRAKKRDYENLESSVSDLKTRIENTKSSIHDKEKELRKVTRHMEDVENQIENAEQLEDSDNLIEALKNSIGQKRANVNEDYTNKLFDDRWILYAFEPILEMYSTKIAEADKKRRTEEHAEIKRRAKEKGIAEGKQQGINSMLGDVLPLNLNVPDRETMEELIHDQLCKVCGREAKKGTEAYAFMKRKLEKLVKQQTPKEQDPLTIEEEEVPLFQNNFVQDLIRMRDEHNNKLIFLRGINGKISSEFEYNQSMKTALEELQKDLTKAESNREDIVGSSATSANRLADNYKNYKVWRKDATALEDAIRILKNTVDSNLTELKNQEKLKQNIEQETAISFMTKNREIAKDIEQILNDTRLNKFSQFAEKLEQKANSYYKKINKGGFTGNIVFEVSKSYSGEMEINLTLKQRDGQSIIISTQGKATETSVYLSCLFALSELSSKTEDESHPLILDAPISSFGRTKSSQFLEVVSTLDFQILLTSKDYTETDEHGCSIIPDFKPLMKRMSKSQARATWLKLDEPFDKEQRHTLNTLIFEQ